MSNAVDALKLIPRAYQDEIFDQARRGNVIAALDTGSGKTFIAALLIKWVMAQPAIAGKKTIFLVPKVPLVDQQRDFLAEQTPLVVRGYKGAMGIDVWDKGKWALEFDRVDCLVMTAQVFKNILIHGYWNMDRISLLVFDECHHAQGNHPYNMIMCDHYFSCKDKPKIFGMTASPIWNMRNPYASIKALQTNLSSRVIAVREHSNSLSQHMNRPTEIVLRFPSSNHDDYSTYYDPSLWELLQAVEFPKLSVKALQFRYYSTLEAVGPVGADYFLWKHATSVVDDYASRADVTPPGSSSGGDASCALMNLVEDRNEAVVLEKLCLALSDFRRRLVLDVRSLPAEWLSPKLRAAVGVLVKHRSDAFQGIIFVDQRQVAMSLSWILRRMAETKGWIRCGELTGHGETKDGYRMKGMDIKTQREIVLSFKAGELNLLVATSVAEEGLDFPACELVIRYDSVKHVVGYVQSRGRARHRNSTYVVMADENNTADIARYEGFRCAEPELKAVYQNMNASSSNSTQIEDGEILEDDDVDPRDLSARESYIIPSTGSTLTYSSAIALLNHLCSLIPKDAYTPSLRPKYILTGEFESTVRLPRALPLSSDHLVFYGPSKRSKKEAKRAVAFMAVRVLHRLGVFDDHLSPITSQKGESIEDVDGKHVAKVSDVAVVMDVLVVSPWKAGPLWYLHIVYLNDRAYAGLLCGTCLPEVDLTVRNVHVQVRPHSNDPPFELSPCQSNRLERFTKMGIRWCVTSSQIVAPLGCFLVPLDPSEAIDWATVDTGLADERGTNDWSAITSNDEGRIMLMNSRKLGRCLRFNRFRLDLPLVSKPSVPDSEGDFASYKDYFEHKYPTFFKTSEKLAMAQPPSGRIIEVSPMLRYPYSSYKLGAVLEQVDDESNQSGSNHLLPESFCRRAVLHEDISHVFHVFAPVCQRLCDVFRARTAQTLLAFPAIADDLLIEALTLPCGKLNFNNQRLETMGDSVLKLSVVVYIFNKYPNKHEGQLDALKANSISNRLLLSRAKEVGLERFLSSEPRHTRAWPHVRSSDAGSDRCKIDSEEIPVIRRSFPRRSLQDCMEASLGAAYVTGGINLALQTGTALGLCFGGSLPWPERYRNSECIAPAALFNSLQEGLQYTFRNGNILVEAVKHPSFDTHEDGSCYQRLEFLGDAVVELVVTTYLFNKFPQATSGQLTWMRSRAICNSTLAAIAVKRHSLHKYLLANNVQLNEDVAREAVTLATSPIEDVALNYWKYDPPKVIADLFESMIGAIFVDCGFDYPVVVPIVEKIMGDVLVLLHPDIPRDPVTRLLEWVTKSGCSNARFQKVQTNPLVERKDGIVVQVHGRVVAGPISSYNKPLAKRLVAEQAMSTLSDESSELELHKICVCMCVEDGEERASDLPERNVREKDLDIETTKGFNTAGRVRLAELREDQVEAQVPESELSDMELEGNDSQEVEVLLSSPISVTSTLEDMDCSD